MTKLFLLLTATLASVSAFTSPSVSRSSPLSTSFGFGQQQRRPMIRTKADLALPINRMTSSASVGDDNTSSNMTAEATSADPTSSKALKKLEREEAKMNKLRQKAMETLNQVEESLNQLQSKKQEYLNGNTLAKTPPGGNFSETTARSAVKALMWRVIAGSVTFVTSLQFSGSIKTALSIVGSDFFSKAFTMFIGERLMNKSQAGRTSGADGAGRSLAKALIWRLFAIANTLTMAIFISKDLSIASKIASTDAVFKTALMYFYERVWARIEWGKEYQVEYYL
eukprot:CAMPEP_0113468102 /NCGR_PEP_ID=MMETSP0014_2-20120614/15175_1 /TAXON_ID=2857 /ORGANISM="Nitzschia sp." /LENGTH=281 /DNA_ID=CAMNT_0000360467 /DNA_START=40 /DNA_END=885 /DNA_ORIENTATION=- /assembly_acc=CAM_ASM_000159